MNSDGIQKKCADIHDLVAKVIEQLESMEYSQSTIVRLNSVWYRFLKYCDTNGIEELTVDVSRKFVLDEFGYVLGDKDACHNTNRAMHMLIDFWNFGMIFKQSSLTLKGFTSGFADLFNGFLSDLESRGYAKGSIRTWRARLFRFEYFLIERGVDKFGKIELHHMNTYIKTLAGFSSGTVGSTIRILGKLSDYAVEKGYHTISFSDRLPVVRRINKYRLPTVFTPEEVETILQSADRNNSIGKRNYAILLLIARLGLRISDVRLLRFDNIDWENKRISIVQQKTGVPLDLPLPEDVGWAIIDYLKNGRPKTSCEHIFVRHLAPYDEFHDNCQRYVVKLVQKAGIHIAPDKPIGMHTFRHSLASVMLEKGTDIKAISQTLGHATPEMTQRYLSIDIEQLRQCALEVMV